MYENVTEKPTVENREVKQELVPDVELVGFEDEENLTSDVEEAPLKTMAGTQQISMVGTQQNSMVGTQQISGLPSGTEGKILDNTGPMLIQMPVQTGQKPTCIGWTRI